MASVVDKAFQREQDKGMYSHRTLVVLQCLCVTFNNREDVCTFVTLSGSADIDSKD